MVVASHVPRVISCVILFNVHQPHYNSQMSQMGHSKTVQCTKLHSKNCGYATTSGEYGRWRTEFTNDYV